MKLHISSSGPMPHEVIHQVGTTVNPPEGERLTMRLRSLDERSGIEAVEVGEAVDNGDLYLLMTMGNGTTETFRINQDGLVRCSSPRRSIKF